MTQLYGLFETDRAQHSGHWTTFAPCYARRLAPSIALPKPRAIIVFQNALIAGALDPDVVRELHVVGHRLDNNYLTQRAHLNTLRNDT